jgi:hypothetical protein
MDVHERLVELRVNQYRKRAEYESEHKGTWTACRYDREPHAGELTEYGWCAAHIDPAARCRIYRNGDQFVCGYHSRYFPTGTICPGLR